MPDCFYREDVAKLKRFRGRQKTEKKDYCLQSLQDFLFVFITISPKGIIKKYVFSDIYNNMDLQEIMLY